MCPNCRAFISSSDRICPYCEAHIGPRAIELRSAEALSTFIPHAYMTSVIILIVNFAMYLAMIAVSVHNSQQPVSESLGSVWQGFSGQVLLLFGGKYGPAITQGGQWWRLLTAGFVHGSLFHIAMNTWVMFDLVAEVEQFYGTARLIIIYLFSTCTGFLLSTMWDPGTISIGASAACFGLIGAMMAIGIGRSHPMAQAIRSYYRRWAVYGIIFSFMPFMRIDVAAHLGGLAGGFIVGYVAGLPTGPKSTRERLCQAIAGVSLLALIYCFLQDLRFFEAFQANMFTQQ